jgi:hypothetical protein
MMGEIDKINPLENKKWLFPETGQGGFHYNDVKNAVAGLEIELMKNYNGKNKDQILQLVERWFPDVSRELKTQIFQEKQNTIL